MEAKYTYIDLNKVLLLVDFIDDINLNVEMLLFPIKQLLNLILI